MRTSRRPSFSVRTRCAGTTHSPLISSGERFGNACCGGGAAGLSGAVALARSRRSVLVVDAREPRNSPADHVHNFLTRDGTPPAELYAAGRAEVARYGGHVEAGLRGGRGRKRQPAEDVRVRVVEYIPGDPGRNRGERYRVATTILSPEAAPATELGALYAERWEAENTLAEWKTHQLGSRNIMTSKSPGLVRQEIYAHLAAHTAVRTLMHQVATCQAEPIDPDRLSFTAALRAVRRSVTSTAGTFSPRGAGRRAGQPRPGTAGGDQPASPASRRDPPGQAEDVPVPVMEPRSSPAGATGQEAG
jgi:Transposase DDE domain